MTVKEIVASYLKEHGYDGLYRDGCGCGLPVLIPCLGEGIEGCSAGYRHDLPCDDCGDPFGCTGSEICDHTFCEHPRKETT